MNTPAALTYVYAVTEPTGPLTQALPRLRGIGDTPLRLLPPAEDLTATSGEIAPLAFVAGDVPERDFNETALKEHFENLDWLEYVARTHHDVVQGVGAYAPLLPLRLAIVYQDDQRASRALTAQHRAFGQRLDQLRAHTEYGVKIYLAASTPPDANQSVAADPAQPIGPGKAYLSARKAQHNARDVNYRQAQLAAQAIEAIAARHTAERARHAPQRGALATAQENVLNDAYLVPDDQAEEFRSALADAALLFPEVRIEVTGPWAPYSFATPVDPQGTRDGSDAPAGARQPPP
ncbi:GvpL/GvpF family gas vesicle protein [Streptomyces sp. NPDC051109]|uniref:GvpL/GvpF family gas vesicle protein n=1 Tax=Streptomyces sp. NPDC051109 TaxID=3365642 RepID=UPI00106645D5